MKKFIGITLLLIFTGLAVFAQVADSLIDTTGMNIDPAVLIPEDFVDLFDIKGWLAGVAEVAGLTIFITAALTKYVLKSLAEPTMKNKRIKWLLSIGVAVLISLISTIANFGYLAEAVWYVALAYGAGSGVIANGWYSIADVKNLLKWLKLKPKV